MQAFVVQLSPLLSAVTAGIKTTVGLHSEARGKPKYPIQRKPIEFIILCHISWFRIEAGECETRVTDEETKETVGRVKKGGASTFSSPVFLCAQIFIKRVTSGYEATTSVSVVYTTPVGPVVQNVDNSIQRTMRLVPLITDPSCSKVG